MYIYIIKMIETENRGFWDSLKYPKKQENIRKRTNVNPTLTLNSQFVHTRHNKKAYN